VLSFEPHLDNVLRCLCNHSLNIMEPIELVPLGLGDREGESTMIEVEVDDANLRAQGDSEGGLLEWVEGTGYEILDAATGRPIASDSPLEGCHFDALCIHPERTVRAES